MDHRLLRVGLLLLAVVLALGECPSLLAQQLPFQVYAAEHGIVVRGGPGEAYYATQDLKHGEELTVYRIEDEDWYAVRPPRGSFSLVSATAVADHGDGTGEVVRSGAASRVGSSITDLQDTVHVRLEKGERIQILGAQMRDGVKWLRIEPPHGEFRWVHRGDVTTSPPDEAPPVEVTEPRASDVLALAQGTDRYGAPLLASEADPNGAAGADAPRPLPPPDAMTQAEGSVETIAPESLKPNSKPAAQPNPAAGDEFAQQMFVMEVELGRTVAEPPTLWNLGGLEQDAAKLLSSAKTEQERDSVRQFAARLERFSSIRRRHELVSPVDGLLATRMPTAGVSAMPQATAVPNTVAQSVSDAGATQPVDSRFDAMGLLRPVASKRADAPKFALVNDAGQIITFVTPAPDVNLQPYVGRRIGVTGTRGYMAEFNHRHVTAGRVMPVGDRLLR
ncbi:MAG: hypothetical protein WD851_09615 [Pirellulales bacterium]